MESVDVRSSAIGVLVIDSNQMQSQLLVRALKRRPEFGVSSCGVEIDAILSAVVSSPVQVAIMNAEHCREGSHDMSVVRRLHLAHPEVAKILMAYYQEIDAKK